MILKEKFIDVIKSLLPILIIISLIFIIPSKNNNIIYNDFYKFLIAFVFVLIGLVFLLLGLDISIDKIAKDLSYYITKTGKRKLVIFISMLVAFIIIIAEPALWIIGKDVSVLSNNAIDKIHVIFSIATSILFFTSIAVLRIIYRLRIKTLLLISNTIALSLLLLLVILNGNLFSLTLDYAASATGAISVPFILSYAIGIGKNIKGSQEKQRFGFVALIAFGAIIGSSVYFLFKYKVNDFNNILTLGDNILSIKETLEKSLLDSLIETSIALSPFIVLFIIFNFIFFKYDKFKLIKLLFGFMLLFIGLLTYLSGLKIGFMNMAKFSGMKIASINDYVAVIFVMLLSFFTLYAESSVQVLTERVFEVSNGSIKTNILKFILALGVSLSGLVIFTISKIDGLKLVYFIIPLYSFAAILSFFAPSLFVSLAYDSGSVASGPLASSFLLPFLQGVSIANNVTSIEKLFGTLAIISIVPIITMLVFGIIYHKKEVKINKLKGVN